MYSAVSSSNGSWKCLSHAVTANNHSFGRLDKSNSDTQINHFCLRNRTYNFILDLPLPELSDMSSGMFLQSVSVPSLYSQPNSLPKMLFSLSFTALSSGASQTSMTFRSCSRLCPPHHIQLILMLLLFPPTYSQINPSISEPNSVDVLPTATPA